MSARDFKREHAHLIRLLSMMGKKLVSEAEAQKKELKKYKKKK